MTPVEAGGQNPCETMGASRASATPRGPTAAFCLQERPGYRPSVTKPDGPNAATIMDHHSSLANVSTRSTRRSPWIRPKLHFDYQRRIRTPWISPVLPLSARMAAQTRALLEWQATPPGSDLQSDTARPKKPKVAKGVLWLAWIICHWAPMTQDSLSDG
jgi:hypothetical protein